jgi:hypothetical protein
MPEKRTRRMFETVSNPNYYRGYFKKQTTYTNNAKTTVNVAFSSNIFNLKKPFHQE